MKMSKRGVIAVISGFSGAGKGTVVDRLVKQYGYALSISATTRAPRAGEKDGESYFFKTKEEFEQMIQDGELMEYARYVEHYYGTPKQYVLEQVEQGKDIILEIETQGALQVKEIFPSVSLIFIVPPSVAELCRRLKRRGTEQPGTVEKRLARAREECAYMGKYDYIVVNDRLEECVSNIHGLLQSIHFSAENQRELAEQIQKDFEHSIN